MADTRLIERARKAAQPFLKNRVIKRAFIGIAMVIVELDDGAVGSSYIL